MSLPESYTARFSGIIRLYGINGAEKLRRAHVCVVGVGGVGSWAVEALARSGIGELTLIDLDDVCVSNVNRQLHALSDTVGRGKVEVLAERARAINPEIVVHPRLEFFTEQNAPQLLQTPFDYLFDAIDSLTNKAALIAGCVRSSIPVITSGGAGGRRDPSQLRIADLALVTNDPLAQKLRKKLRSEYGFPAALKTSFGVPCVFTTEPAIYPQQDGSVCDTKDPDVDLKLTCEAGYGSATFVTGAFGFAAAAHICKAIAER